jgi:hypothetical protein
MTRASSTRAPAVGPGSQIVDTSRNWRECDGCTQTVEPPQMRFRSNYMSSIITRSITGKTQLFWVANHYWCYKNIINRNTTRNTARILFTCEGCKYATATGQSCRVQINNSVWRQKRTKEPTSESFCCGSCSTVAIETKQANNHRQPVILIAGSNMEEEGGGSKGSSSTMEQTRTIPSILPDLDGWTHDGERWVQIHPAT